MLIHSRKICKIHKNGMAKAIPFLPGMKSSFLRGGRNQASYSNVFSMESSISRYWSLVSSGV